MLGATKLLRVQYSSTFRWDQALSDFEKIRASFSYFENPQSLNLQKFDM